VAPWPLANGISLLVAAELVCGWAGAEACEDTADGCRLDILLFSGLWLSGAQEERAKVPASAKR
jgi:hypothetical protein